MTSKTSNIKEIINDGDWALFLDRDGVINRRLVDDYVKKTSEFEFLPKVLESIAIFSKVFKYVFIVTNQQGIGKGLMSEADLEIIHRKMVQKIEAQGGRIDKIYHCPDLASSNSENRKPEIGMALQAQKDFPDIEFSKSLMAGDSKGDIRFGKNAGMTTVFINSDKLDTDFDADFAFESLGKFGDEIGIID